jgi:hypothetical protein
MYRRAMPADPRILEQDFESSEDALSDIESLLFILRAKKSKLDITEKEKDFIVTKINRLWFDINNKRGINLRDREKLLPIFQELDRLIGKTHKPSFVFRGVNLPKYDPLALSEAYGTVSYDEPFKPNSRITQQLEYLAYGLRSWSSSNADAHTWAKGHYNRDRLVFRIQDPDVVLDGTAVLQFFKSGSMFDKYEYVLNLQDPKIISVTRYDETYDFFAPEDKQGNLWEILIKDM